MLALVPVILPGVDFIKFGRKAGIIEIALSIFTQHLCLTFETLFTSVNVWRWVQKIGAGHETVYEIEPRQLGREEFQQCGTMLNRLEITSHQFYF